MKIVPIAVAKLVVSAAVVSAVWTPPLDSMGVACGGTSIKTGDGGEYTCFQDGEAICRDNYPGPFGSWMFAIKDGTVKLLDPNNQVSWQFCADVTHVCIGEDHTDRFADPNNPKFSQQRPYMFFYDEKIQEKVGELQCDGTDGFDKENIDKSSLLKMVDNSMLGGYVNYGKDGIPVVKFKKGQTDDPADINSLWQVAVNATGHGFMSFNKDKCTWTQNTCNITDVERLPSAEQLAEEVKNLKKQVENNANKIENKIDKVDITAPTLNLPDDALLVANSTVTAGQVVDITGRFEVQDVQEGDALLNNTNRGRQLNQATTCVGLSPGNSFCPSDIQAALNPEWPVLQDITRDMVSLLQDLVKCMELSSSADELIVQGCDFIVRGNGGSTNPDLKTNRPTGKGNLIVGYNEGSPKSKTGLNNLVVGPGHTYTSTGGAVFGNKNTISATSATVTGGSSNTAHGQYASVSGGSQNKASALSASVSGGLKNTASNEIASVSGGQSNEASGKAASVSGGDNNKASALGASVSGGSQNIASALSASVSGGIFNKASNEIASVSGGEENVASGIAASVSGGYQNTASGYAASVTGGERLTANENFQNKPT